jgi:hypothetical protein
MIRLQLSFSRRERRYIGNAPTARHTDQMLLRVRCRLWFHKRTLADVQARSAPLSIVLQKSFAARESNSLSHRRDDRVIMRGTTRPSAKLTGDSACGFEAALIGDCRLFRLSAEK